MARFGIVDVVEVAKAARSEWDRAIGVLATRQHGVVTHRQLRAIGLSPAAIRARKTRGLLIDLHHGVYAVAYLPFGPHGHWTAAVLACGPGAVLSHAAAAALWKIRASSATRIDVTSPTRAGRGRRGIRVHRAGRLLASHVTEVEGVPCTTVARTILDLAGVLALGPLEYAIHQAQVNEVFNRDEVVEAIAAAPTRRGTAAVRRILGISHHQEDQIKSWLARRLWRLCRAAGLPEPLIDHWVALPDGGGYEVDFCWPDHRLILEADGRAVHDTHRGFENDRLRDRRLRLAGWQVARFTDRDVTERPDEVKAHLNGLIAAAVVGTASTVP
jgi:predicted transcriptional regulator of viral defense system/very-short-patch-repair endonuclease